VGSKAALNRFLVVVSQESSLVAGYSTPTSVQFEYLFVYILKAFASEHYVYSLSYLFDMAWEFSSLREALSTCLALRNLKISFQSRRPISRKAQEKILILS
jgi:hypothetical protein